MVTNPYNDHGCQKKRKTSPYFNDATLFIYLLFK